MYGDPQYHTTALRLLEAAWRPDAPNHCPLLTCLSIVEDWMLRLMPVSVGLRHHQEKPELSLSHRLPRSEGGESMEPGSQGELPERMGLVLGHRI